MKATDENVIFVCRNLHTYQCIINAAKYTYIPSYKHLKMIIVGIDFTKKAEYYVTDLIFSLQPQSITFIYCNFNPHMCQNKCYKLKYYLRNNSLKLRFTQHIHDTEFIKEIIQNNAKIKHFVCEFVYQSLEYNTLKLIDDLLKNNKTITKCIIKDSSTCYNFTKITNKNKTKTLSLLLSLSLERRCVYAIKKYKLTFKAEKIISKDLYDNYFRAYNNKLIMHV